MPPRGVPRAAGMATSDNSLTVPGVPGVLLALPGGPGSGEGTVQSLSPTGQPGGCPGRPGFALSPLSAHPEDGAIPGGRPGRRITSRFPRINEDFLVRELLARCHKLSENHKSKMIDLAVRLLRGVFKYPGPSRQRFDIAELTNHPDRAGFWGISLRLCCFPALGRGQGGSPGRAGVAPGTCPCPCPSAGQFGVVLARQTRLGHL